LGLRGVAEVSRLGAIVVSDVGGSLFPWAWASRRRSSRLLAEALERLAQQGFGVERYVGVARALLEGTASFARFEAEPTQAVVDLLAHVCPWGGDGAAVRGAVGVLKDEGIWRSARDMDLSSMDGAVVHRANTQLVVGMVRAALGAWLNVVHVEREGVPAARDLTILLGSKT
jgi:hypothetical protein